MEFSRVLIGLVVILWALVVGLSVIAFSQILLAIREIALNTRREDAKHHHGHYAILLVVAKINTVLGWIIVIAGVLAGLYVIIFGIPAFAGLTASVTETGYLRP